MSPDHGFKLNRHSKTEKMTLYQSSRPKDMVVSDMASAIFCVSQTHQFIKPGVIFKDTENVATGCGPKRQVYAKRNRLGWADGDATYDWLENIFEDETRPAVRPNEDLPWRMLIASDPSSRLDEKFFMSCMEKRILCFRLPNERGASDRLDPFSCGISGFINVKFSEKVEDQWGGGQSNSPIQIDPKNFCDTMWNIARGPEFPVVRTARARKAWTRCALVPTSITIPDNTRTPSPPRDVASQQEDVERNNTEPMHVHDYELSLPEDMLVDDLESSTFSPIVTPSRMPRPRKRRRHRSRPGNEEREHNGMHETFISFQHRINGI